MIKSDTIQKKIKRVKDTLDRMERGLYVGVSIGWVTDQIAWLWKFRHINYDEMTQLTARARYIISTYKPD